MKKSLFIFVSFLAIICCKAQSILPLFGDAYDIDGVYYKDIDNDLDQFAGTWKWQNGNTFLIIVLEKRTQVPIDYSNISTFEDILIGGYKYVENGVEVVNTIPLMNNQYTDIYDYPIVGNRLIANDDIPQCNSCLPNERRVSVYIHDPQRDYLMTTITLRHYGGEISLPGQDPPEFIHMIMRGDHAILPTETSPTWIRVPRQEYTLEKQ